MAIADLCVFITLIGVCVSSQINIATLIKDVIGDAMDLNTLVVLSAAVVYPISCFRNMSGLAKMSPIGMFCLLLNVAAIVGYGILLYWDQITNVEMPLWPSSLPDMAAYGGVAIFCFGLCSLVFQVEESMEHSDEFSSALAICLCIVCITYFFVGDGVALLYSHAPQGIYGNVLLNLPQHDFISVFSRFAMVAVSYGFISMLCLNMHVVVIVLLFVVVIVLLCFTCGNVVCLFICVFVCVCMCLFVCMCVLGMCAVLSVSNDATSEYFRKNLFQCLSFIIGIEHGWYSSSM